MRVLGRAVLGREPRVVGGLGSVAVQRVEPGAVCRGRSGVGQHRIRWWASQRDSRSDRRRRPAELNESPTRLGQVQSGRVQVAMPPALATVATASSMLACAWRPFMPMLPRSTGSGRPAQIVRDTPSVTKTSSFGGVGEIRHRQPLIAASNSGIVLPMSAVGPTRRSSSAHRSRRSLPRLASAHS